MRAEDLIQHLKENPQLPVVLASNGKLVELNGVGTLNLKRVGKTLKTGGDEKHIILAETIK